MDGELSYPNRRKRLHRYEEPGPRFLTFSCFQRYSLFSNDLIKTEFVGHLQRARVDTKFRLLAGVIMPEHVHLLLVPDLPTHPVSEVSSRIKRHFAERVIRRWRELDAPVLKRLEERGGRTGFWQAGGGYDRNVRDERELLEAMNYIHQNPVKRGLVASETDWSWSSASWYAGKSNTLLAIDPIDP